MCEQVLGKERNGVIARRGRRGQESLLFFKLGELIAHVHADGSASVQGKGSLRARDGGRAASTLSKQGPGSCRHWEGAGTEWRWAWGCTRGPRGAGRGPH